jgi:hypothetical protein
MLGGFYSTGSLRMASSQHLEVHRVVKKKVKFRSGRAGGGVEV